LKLKQLRIRLMILLATVQIILINVCQTTEDECPL
jgi:hypothetical protein